MKDASNGYDAIAREFIAVRSATGREAVKKWASSLPAGCAVIDVGAGHGEPLTSVLIDGGLDVSALDASPKMVAAFKERFPGVPIACEAAEASEFFDRTFDAALAVGLIFLLPEDGQRALVRGLSKALRPGGRLLFSAPWQTGEWTDILTGHTSRSLGSEAYGALLKENGLSLSDRYEDEEANHYYEAVRR